MNRFQAIGVTIKKNFTVRRVIGTLFGTLLLGIGIAGLRLSLMGNDPYTAMNLALSGGFHMGLGTIICAFFMGPLIDLFRKVNARWINP